MHLSFKAISEEHPGDKWKAQYAHAWAGYSAWFLREGDARRPGYMSCRRALAAHMPELLPMWENLVSIAGGSDQAARMLSLYCPTPFLVGCSQALWTRDEPVLVRNYDYHPALCEGVILCSAWHGTRVIASVDCLWGALDGMNEHGLAASLSFGGRPMVGKGFGVPLIVRYILEFCKSVGEAVALLKRVPCNMAYSVGLIDADAEFATVHINPDCAPVVTTSQVTTNHQQEVVWPEHADLTGSVQRAEFLALHLANPDETQDVFVKRFLHKPLVSTAYSRAFGTLYTAIYKPKRGEVEFRWPNRSWHQSFEHFIEGVSVVQFPAG